MASVINETNSEAKLGGDEIVFKLFPRYYTTASEIAEKLFEAIVEFEAYVFTFGFELLCGKSVFLWMIGENTVVELVEFLLWNLFKQELSIWFQDSSELI